MAWDDPDIGEGLDPDGPSAEDLDRFGDEFITCPNCHKSVYDQTEMCPYCGHGVSDPVSRAPIWTIVVVLALIAVFVLFLIPF